MNINPSLSLNIQQQHIHNTCYALDEADEIVTTESLNKVDGITTAKRLLLLAQDPSKPEKDRQILAACAFDYVRALEKKLPPEEFQDVARDHIELHAQALLLVLKKPITFSAQDAVKKAIVQNSDWYQLIVKNNIHYMVHRQPFVFAPQDDYEVANHICIAGVWVRFEQLTKLETPNGYDFLLNKKLAFSTDKNFKLNDHFWAGAKGILKGSPTQVDDFGCFFKRPASGKFWVSAYCAAKDLNDLAFGHSHSYMGLEDNEGNYISVGQYGVVQDLKLSDYLVPFGKKKVGVESPERYSSVPLSKYQVNEAKIEVTKQQYDKLLQSVKEDKQNGHEGSLIKGNCTTYVKRKLALIGVEAKTTMTVQRYLFGQALRILPKPWQDRIVKWINKIPESIRKICLFCPLIYFPTIAVCLVARPLCDFKSKSDISIFHAIFTPWELKIDHPTVFFEWLSECQRNEKDYKVFQADVTDTSDIGKIVLKTMSDLGYKAGAQARLRLSTAEHITQYGPGNFVSMALQATYRAIKHKLDSFLTKERQLNNNTLLLYIHTLKNQRFIDPYQFQCLKDSIDNDKQFIKELHEIIESLHAQKKIDRRAFIHSKDLLSQQQPKQALSYVISLALITQLDPNIHGATMQKLLTPEVQMMLEQALTHYHRTFSFNVSGVQSIQKLCSRISCFEWTAQLEDDEMRNQLQEAIISRDENTFTLCLRKYFDDLTHRQGISPTEKATLKEIAASIEFPEGENAFVNFAHLLQTQQVIQSLERNLSLLHSQLEQHRDAISDDLINDLKLLHQNIGVSLASDAAYVGSATYLSAHLGGVRQMWEHISDHIASIKGSSSILPSANEKDSWPDIGLREIKPVTLPKIEMHPNGASAHPKKVFFGYCSWGNGHRSITDALQKYLSAKYRVASCDIPDEVLIERDPLFHLMGTQHSITSLYNTLVAGNYWGVLRIIRKLGSKPTPQQEFEIERSLVKRKILQERPDLIVATYQKHANVLCSVAKELGIPFLLACADMACEIVPPDATDAYEHMKVAIPYRIPQMEEKLHTTPIKDQIVSFGYPIRPEFLEKLDKTALKAKYQVAENEKIILCMNGGLGGDTPWPKLIAEAQEGSLGRCRLVVVCGNNQVIFDKLKDIAAIDPNISIDVRNFVDAKTMAELCEIADVTITKPGGGTTAENIAKKNYMLLDTRFSKELVWELETANVIEQYEMGEKVGNKEDFIVQLKNALQKGVPHIDAFHGPRVDPAQGFLNIVSQLIQRAETDRVLMGRKQKGLELKESYPSMSRTADVNRNYEQIFAELLMFNEKLNPEQILPSLKRSLWAGPYVKFNMEKSRFEPHSVFLFRDMQYALHVLKQAVIGGAPIPNESLVAMIKMALCVQSKDSKKTAALIDDLCCLDRYRLSKECHVIPENERSLERVQNLLLVPQAKDLLKKWVGLKTSNGRKKGTPEMMMSEKDAIDVFLNHPEEYDFVQKLFLHRKASAFNHPFKVEDKHLYILYQGVPTKVSELIHRFKYLNERIIHIDSEVEFTYTYNEGLSPIKPDQDPYEWKTEIPLFKKKQRKTADYRVEVMSIVGEQNHGWIRLKDPEGNVYSMGRIWDRDYQLHHIQRCTTIKGTIRAAGDVQEFLGREEDWKRTVLTLNSKENFEKIKHKIKGIQSTNKSYNLVNQNCVTFVGEIMSSLGIPYKPNASALTIFSPLPKSLKKTMKRHQQVGKIVSALAYPLTVLSNSLLAAFGMRRSHDTDDTRPGLNRIWDVLSYKNSMIDHPSQLRLLQEILEEDHPNSTVYRR